MWPKDLYIKDLVISLWHFWEIVKLLGVGTLWKKLGHWEHDFERDFGTPVLSCLFLCFPDTMKWASCSSENSLTRRKALPNTQFLFINWLPQIFCLRDGELIKKPTNTPVILFKGKQLFQMHAYLCLNRVNIYWVPDKLACCINDFT